VFIITVCDDSDYTADESSVWDKVSQFVSEEMCDSLSSESDLTIDPVILGERHIPEQRYVTAQNALPSNASLRNVCRALSWGVVANLRSMSPHELPKDLVRIVGSGGALARNAVMRQAVSKLFGLPLHVDLTCGNADSAVGAAIAGVRYLLKPAE
jgi:sugar (pentulose or hexulose) kinase